MAVTGGDLPADLTPVSSADSERTAADSERTAGGVSLPVEGNVSVDRHITDSLHKVAKDRLPKAHKDNNDIADTDEGILREMCLMNGVNYEKLSHGGGSRLKKLEIFFFGCSRIPKGIHKFYSLFSLCIVNQQFQNIIGLEGCPLLEELWICETQVELQHLESDLQPSLFPHFFSENFLSSQVIEDLFNCPQLVKLYLYSNKISVIEGLHTLSKLEKLWLNGNFITAIEGLDKLEALKTLNLSCNQITTIGSALDQLTHLQVLNLSGNKIASLIEIVHLTPMRSLKDLSFCHPLSPPNPICFLCNYSTHILYHLPHLDWLDGREVGLPELQSLVQELVQRKIQYYRMHMHHSRSSAYHCKLKLKSELSRTLNATLYPRLRTLSIYRKMLEFTSVSEGDDVQVVSKQLHIVHQQLFKAHKNILNQCSTVDYEYAEKCQRYLTELESGGNVKLMICGCGHGGMKACCELLQSRFSVQEMQQLQDSVLKGLELTGIKVTKVTRIENRLLFNSFNDKLKTLLDKDPYSSMTLSQVYSKMVNYLFLVWQEDSLSVYELAQHGFPTTTPAAVPYVWLTNSISRAEHLRLAKEFKVFDGLHGELLVCKVFIGEGAEMLDLVDWPSLNQFPGADSVFRVLGQVTESCSSEFYPKDWFIADHNFVLPEYIVKFKYLSIDPCINMDTGDVCGLLRVFENMCDVGMECKHDTPHYAMMDEATLLQHTQQDSLASIQHINLFNNRLTRFRLSSSLPNLTTLILCANEFTSVEDFTDIPNLEVLDISFNQLTHLRGLKALAKLKCLDLSWNFLSDSREDLHVLCKNCPMLEVLDVRYNPWKESRQIDDYILTKLNNLCKVNGRSISEEELQMARRRAKNWLYPTMAALMARASTTTTPFPNLSPYPLAHSVLQLQLSAPEPIPQPVPLYCPQIEAHTTADVISHPSCQDTPSSQPPPSSFSLGGVAPPPSSFSLGYMAPPPCSPAAMYAEDICWSEKVTVLCMCGLCLTSISFLSQFPNLKWLSVADNFLTSIKGILQCPKLQELTMDNNSISSMEGIGQLSGLTWLSLSRNRLTALSSCFRSLKKLCYFNASENNLSTLQELKHLTSLTEVYLSSNSVAKLRQLFVLKALTSLLVLDLTFNPVTAAETYRLFVIFHFHSLKALDGCTVDELEVAEARDKLGGWLTQDFIFQKYPSLKFTEIVKLDLPSVGLKHVDMSPVDSIGQLVSLNLENNCLTTFSGLIHLNSLKVLCLNNNRIESLLPLSGAGPASNYHCLLSLQVLHLAENGISNLFQLHFESMPSLKALFLQGNDISHVEGLGTLPNLMELVLDRNKIKVLLEQSLAGLPNLKELHLEENRLKSLSNISCYHLERLYLGLNRIQDFTELEKLNDLEHLVEISIINNPVSRRLQHRLQLIHQHPSLIAVDGTMVTEEELQLAEDAYNGGEKEDEVYMDCSCTNGALVPSGLAFNANMTTTGSLKVQNMPYIQSHYYHQYPQNSQLYQPNQRYIQQPYQEKRTK